MKVPRIRRAASALCGSDGLVKRNFDVAKNALRDLELDQGARALERGCRDWFKSQIGEAAVLRARAALETSLDRLRQRRAQLEAGSQSEQELGPCSRHSGRAHRPDILRLDQAIQALEAKQDQLVEHHDESVQALEAFGHRRSHSVASRLAMARAEANRYAADKSGADTECRDLLQKSFWFSALSIPVSVWSDVNQASNIYSVLRDVNSNFADLSDSEIWFQTLSMPAESLAGLISLTKGAYFERLVEAEFGGTLHEYFNQPATDIEIDGVEYQIKATADTAYLDSVPEPIPLISTSEVSETTRAIDGGWTHEELVEMIELALGGPIVDAAGVALDAVATGFFGFGLFASVAGASHAIVEYQRGAHPLEAAAAGTCTAFERTTAPVRILAKYTYNVLTSERARELGDRVRRNGAEVIERCGGDRAVRSAGG